MKTNGNDQAHPIQFEHESVGKGFHLGLSKREYFAALSLQGILANTNLLESVYAKDFASMAIMRADDLIAELNRGDKE